MSKPSTRERRAASASAAVAAGSRSATTAPASALRSARAPGLAARRRPASGVRFDPDQLGAALDLGVDVGEHLGDPAGGRGAQRRLQLHALHDGHDVALRDLVAGRDRDGHHHGRGRGADQPGLAAGDPVHRAVDLDQVVRALRDREHVEGLAADAQPQLEPARPLDVDVHRTAVEFHAGTGPAGTGTPAAGRPRRRRGRRPGATSRARPRDARARRRRTGGPAGAGRAPRRPRRRWPAGRRRPAAAGRSRRPSSCPARSCRPRRGRIPAGSAGRAGRPCSWSRRG